MGAFDSVLVPCPKCGGITEAQSKSGPCCMEEFSLENAPTDVMADVNRHAPFTCRECQTTFHVDAVQRVTVSEDRQHTSPEGPFQTKADMFLRELERLCKTHDMKIEAIVALNDEPRLVVRKGFQPMYPLVIK